MMSPLFWPGVVFVVMVSACYVIVKTSIKEERILSVEDVAVLAGVFAIIALFDYLIFFHNTLYWIVCLIASMALTLSMFLPRQQRDKWWQPIVGFTVFYGLSPVIIPLIICVGYFKLDEK